MKAKDRQAAIKESAFVDRLCLSLSTRPLYTKHLLQESYQL
jgi:hypothetical protein